MRPAHITRNKFLMKFRKGKCAKQVTGINKIDNIPKLIVKFLKKSNSNLYLGTSAALHVDAGTMILPS